MYKNIKLFRSTLKMKKTSTMIYMSKQERERITDITKSLYEWLWEHKLESSNISEILISIYEMHIFEIDHSKYIYKIANHPNIINVFLYLNIKPKWRIESGHIQLLSESNPEIYIASSLSCMVLSGLLLCSRMF